MNKDTKDKNIEKYGFNTIYPYFLKFYSIVSAHQQKSVYKQQAAKCIEKPCYIKPSNIYLPDISKIDVSFIT
jgi:hypothetical protein